MPSPQKIRAAVPLSQQQARPLAGQPFTCCVCGLPDAGDLTAWREHDERDRPIPGPAHVVFLCPAKACRKVLDDHPRLYDEITGDPGMLPRLCGPCIHRCDNGTCAHVDLKRNGGPGLNVTLGGPGVAMRNAIICNRQGRVRLPVYATACVGRQTREAQP